MFDKGLGEQSSNELSTALKDAMRYGWTPSNAFISKCVDPDRVISEIKGHLGRIQAGDGQIRVATTGGQLALVSPDGPSLVDMVKVIGFTPTKQSDLRAIQVFRGRKSMPYSDLAPLLNPVAE